jgi:hypothetical protein
VHVSDDVASLVAKIETRSHVAREHFYLTHAGRRLDDRSTIAAYGISHHKTVHCAMRGRGGSGGDSSGYKELVDKEEPTEQKEQKVFAYVSSSAASTFKAGLCCIFVTGILIGFFSRGLLPPEPVGTWVAESMPSSALLQPPSPSPPPPTMRDVFFPPSPSPPPPKTAAPLSPEDPSAFVVEGTAGEEGEGADEGEQEAVVAALQDALSLALTPPSLPPLPMLPPGECIAYDAQSRTFEGLVDYGEGEEGEATAAFVLDSPFAPTLFNYTCLRAGVTGDPCDVHVAETYIDQVRVGGVEGRLRHGKPFRGTC